MIARVLESESDIDNALGLLYDVYVKEMNWNPSDGNASGYRIVDNKLYDNFVERSTYFGVYEGDKIISTGRVIHPGNTPVEIGQYLPNHSVLQGKTAELNRVAIPRKYFESIAPILLFESIFSWCFENLDAQNLVTTVGYPNPGQLFEKLGFEKASDAFRYGPTDLGDVYLYSLLNNQTNLMKVLNMLENLKELSA
ncbi:MAG: hypothetical protein R2827_07575 [Bdellovibrionales bacterium]